MKRKSILRDQNDHTPGSNIRATPVRSHQVRDSGQRSEMAGIVAGLPSRDLAFVSGSAQPMEYKKRRRKKGLEYAIT
jgi:hypothetical protein